MTDPFYTNREIWEKLTEKIDGLSKELTKTQQLVSAYNGLRETIDKVEGKVDDVCKAVDAMVNEGTGKNKLASGLSWSIGIVGALIGIAGGVLAIASRL